MIDKNNNKYDSGFNQARVHLLSFGQKNNLFEQKQKLHAQIRKIDNNNKT